jgi:hypothetical protein
MVVHFQNSEHISGKISGPKKGRHCSQDLADAAPSAGHLLCRLLLIVESPLDRSK